MESGSQEIQAAFRSVQDHIGSYLTEMDGKDGRQDRWRFERGRGGGITRIWENGNLWEKGGVNFSAIEGNSLPPSALAESGIAEGTPFLATGVSLVMHPRSPFVPTIHMNIRYFEAGESWWFGGGIDCTPYYPVEGRIVAFHRALRALCREHGRDYGTMKRLCDEYFFIRHRREARGVGGIFFDHVRTEKPRDLDFVRALGMGFPGLYAPFVEGGKDRPFGERERQFQLYRRSRYAEFNLVYDRGTHFGLQSGGRTESILMSLPPLCAWRYAWQPQPGTPEARLTDYFLKPRDWADMDLSASP